MSMDNGVLYPMDVPPGYVRDPDQIGASAPLTIVTSVFFAITTLLMGVRLYTRGVIVGKLLLDDYIMFAAWIFDTLLCAFSLNMLRYGMGKHLWNVPMTPDLFPNFSLSNTLAATFFNVSTGLAKGSILLFYLRIFPSKKVHAAVWACFVVAIGYSFAGALVNIFACNPASASWRLEDVATAKCINRPVFYMVMTGMGIATDVATVLIPVPLLRDLHLPRRQKIGVAVMLTMGAFVCVISGVRMQSLIVLLNDSDLTTNTVPALTWCVLEINLSIIGGSIPSAKPFAQKLFPGILGTSRGRSTGDAIYLHSSRSRPKNTGNHSSSTPGISSGYKGTIVSSNRHDDGTGSEEFIFAKSNGDRVAGGDPMANIVKTVQYGYEVDGSREDLR